MITAKSFPEVEEHIASDPMVFLYLSQPKCSVCQTLLPKVENLLAQYPNITFLYVNTADIPLAAGQLSVFSIPTVMLFADGKEFLKLVRTFGIQEIQYQIDRIYEHFQ